MIHDVLVKLVPGIMNAQGGVVHMVRSDEPLFTRFGEVYFSITNPGVVKGWHLHDEQINLHSCIVGTVKLVLYDARDDSPTRGEIMEILYGEGQYKVVKIPPGVVYGWTNVGETAAIVANCASHVHDASKSTKIDIDSGKIPYTW